MAEIYFSPGRYLRFFQAGFEYCCGTSIWYNPAYRIDSSAKKDIVEPTKEEWIQFANVIPLYLWYVNGKAQAITTDNNTEGMDVDRRLRKLIRSAEHPGGATARVNWRWITERKEMKRFARRLFPGVTYNPVHGGRSELNAWGIFSPYNAVQNYVYLTFMNWYFREQEEFRKFAGQSKNLSSFTSYLKYCWFAPKFPLTLRYMKSKLSENGFTIPPRTNFVDGNYHHYDLINVTSRLTSGQRRQDTW